jgi:hypothetical protein
MNAEQSGTNTIPARRSSSPVPAKRRLAVLLFSGSVVKCIVTESNLRSSRIPGSALEHEDV